MKIRMTENERMTFIVDTPQGLMNALYIAKNTLMPHYSILCENTSSMFGSSPIIELQKATELANSFGGCFSESQLRLTSNTYKVSSCNNASIIANRKYMCSTKEANDVRCVAAEIGEILRAKLKGKTTFENALRVYQKWINQFFEYKNTGSINDHTAIGLLTNRTGVCQAIASMTVLIFPYLGFPTQYVSGNACGGSAWGLHAWNAILYNNYWIHVDFTFGVKSLFPPNTLTSINRRAFLLNHSWDENVYSGNSLTGSQTLFDQIKKSKIELFENRKTLIIGNVVIQSEVPIMIGNCQDGHWIALFRLLPLIGGSCEYLPDRNQIRICLCNHQKLIEQADRYMTGSQGYVSVSIIREFADILEGNDKSITIGVR